MDLRRLEIFVKVAELGSFSRAAETLFLTQPTVSEHVRALEDELGVPLLDCAHLAAGGGGRVRARLLACVKIRGLKVARAFHLVTHRDRSRSPLAQAFLAFVESHVAERPS